MSNYALMPLNSYKMKVAGIIFSVISIALMVIVSYADDFILIKAFDKEAHFNLFFLANGIALFWIAFSKEKNEDERISLIRDRTFRATAGVSLTTLISISFVSTVFNSQPVHPGQAFPFLINVILVFHLLLFYYRIYYNIEIDHEEVSAIQNIRNNKKLFIAYLIINIIAAILLLFL